nr:hypothetical protein [Microbacterium sp. SORGH_AS_0421]
MATAGIVFGSYQRCGLSVLSGRPSTSCATITERLLSGEAFSRSDMKSSYPRPFCTMSCAPAISFATLALASNVCGSVLGSLRIADTSTRSPPICCTTSAYSFSAATTATFGPESAVASGVGADAPVAHPARTSVSRETEAAAVTTVRVVFMEVGSLRRSVPGNENRYHEAP